MTVSGASELFENVYSVNFTNQEREEFNEFMDSLPDLNGTNYSIRKFNNRTAFINAAKEIVEMECNRIHGTRFNIGIPIYTLRPMALYSDFKLTFANRRYKDISRVVMQNLDDSDSGSNLIIYAIVEGRTPDGQAVYNKRYEALVYNEKLDIGNDKIIFTDLDPNEEDDEEEK